MHLFDYSKSIISTKGQVILQCKQREQPHDAVFQVITSSNYYSPLFGLRDSTLTGILQFDIEHVNQLAAAPIGELTLEYITSIYPNLFEGLGELGHPLSLKLNQMSNLFKLPHIVSLPQNHQ